MAAFAIKNVVLCFLLIASTALAAPTEWSVAGDRTLRITRSGEELQLVPDDGVVLHTFGPTDEVQGSALSSSRTCLLLVVNIERLSERRPDTQSFDYGYLLRIKGIGSGEVQVNRLLEHTSETMRGRKRFVSELGAVSDDGKTALLKFAEADAEEAPYTMDYQWQTWDLDAPRRISVGLTLGHSAPP